MRVIVRPSPSLTDPDEQLRARLLSALLFAFSMGMLGLAILLRWRLKQTPGSPIDIIDAENKFFYAGMSAFVAYTFSRTRYHALAVVMWVLGNSFLIVSEITAAPVAEVVALGLVWPALHPVVASLVLSITHTLLITLISAMPYLALLYRYSSGDLVGTLYVSSFFFLTAASFSLLGAVVRRRAETARRESEDRYRRMVETTNEAVLTLDPRGVVNFANQRASQLLERPPHEILGKSIFHLISKDYEEIVRRKLQNRSQIFDTYDVKFERKTGKQMWAILSASPIFGENKAYLGSLSTLTDITQRKNAEEALRESEARLRFTLEAASVYTWEWDYRRKTFSRSAGFDRLFGLDWDLAEWNIPTFLAFVHPEDQTNVMKRLETAFTSPQRTPLEFRVVWPNGSIHWLTLSGRDTYDSNGLPERAVGLLFDVSTRKETEAAIRTNEEKFRSIFNNAAVGIVLLGPAGEILDSNKALQRLLGFDDDEMMGHRYLDLFLAEERERGRQQILYRPPGAPLAPTGEFRFVRRDGTDVWARVTVSQIDRADGSMRQTLAILEDITARKIAENQILEQQSQMAAASKMSALGEMAGSIAHEINNPLTVIYGKASQLKRKVELGTLDSTWVVAMAEKIEATALRISQIVKSLREFSRDGSADPFQTSLVKTIVEETLEMCQERFRHHNVALIIDSFPETLTLDCRSVQIAQVLLNLLNNAFDAVETSKEKWVRLTVTEAGDKVELAVTDSGPGIPELIRERILMPFFTTKEIGKGTGLGLSVSKGIVDSHRGNLRLDTQATQTRFVILLPKTQPIPLENVA